MIRTKKPSQASHLMLDGGMFYFETAQQEALFLENYANEMQISNYNIPHFYVERKTPVFWMFMELDYIGDKPLTDEEVDNIAKFFHSCVCNCYKRQLNTANDQQKSLAVYRAACKTVSNGVKSGIHLIWRIPVNTNAAWQLRQVILQELKSDRFDIPNPCIPWSDVIDSCVFKDNGLRMVGSRKTEICPDCKNKIIPLMKNGTGCSTCQMSGKIDAGRPYTFYKIFNASGEIDEKMMEEYTLNIGRAVIRGSIRCHESKKWDIDWGDACYSKVDICNAVSVEKKRKPSQPLPALGRRPRVSGDLDKKILDLQSEEVMEEYKQLFEFISDNFNGNPTPTKLVRVSNEKMTCPIYFMNTNCRWCINNMGEHTNSKIYFVIQCGGVSQRCYCQNSTTRKFSGAHCRDFSSTPVPLTKELMKKYFTKQAISKTMQENKKRVCSVIDDNFTENGNQRQKKKKKHSPETKEENKKPRSPSTSHTQSTAYSVKELFVASQTAAFKKYC